MIMVCRLLGGWEQDDPAGDILDIGKEPADSGGLLGPRRAGRRRKASSRTGIPDAPEGVVADDGLDEAVQRRYAGDRDSKVPGI
jgi:hypothetical protein